MERRSRPRSKSASEKKQQPAAKSPKGRAKKPAKGEVKKREPSRSRSRAGPSSGDKDRKRGRSRSVSKTRGSSRSRATPKKKDSSPKLVLTDVIRGSGDATSIDEVIRRSLSREKGLTRRSTRVATRDDKLASWPKVTETPVAASKPEPTSRVEFGGWAGAFVQIVGNLLLVGTVLLGCTKDQCLLKPFHIPRNWRVYLNAESALAVTGFFVIQALLALLPLGRVVRTPGGTTSYRANGCLVAILTGCGLAGAWYYGCPVTLAYERWISLAVSGYIFAWLLSIVLFVKGGYAPVIGLNPYGNSGNRLYDFFAGREVNPCLFNRINVKVLLLRSCVIASLLLDCLLALKGWEVRKQVPPTLLTAVALRALYCIDVLWFEESFSSTFESQYDGLGFMNVQGLILYPFLTGVIPRFILTHRVELSLYALGGIVAAFLIGYFIYRASNLQKATFRKNPHDPTVSHLETISTSRGKKLLVSGWWGIVKHPNYLGDIILHWAMAAPTGVTHALPYIVPLVLTVSFVYRAKRDDRRCSERYQGAWAEYTRRVPNYIFPKIY